MTGTDRCTPCGHTAADHYGPGDAGHDRDGQGRLVKDAALGVSEAAREKRETLDVRVAKAKALVDESPDDHFILWHDLETERHALKATLPDAVEVYGNLDLDIREERIIGFSDGEYRLLATKPELSGSGCNFQRHCHRAIFVGVGFQFNDFIQAVHRIQRFQQPHPVRIDIIYADSEIEVVKTLRRKWTQHDILTATMSEVIRAHGLDQVSATDTLTRSMGIQRSEVSGTGWLLANNDCVKETTNMNEGLVDLIVTSIPFSNHYEYTPSYNDFGHTEDNAHFWAQMDYLTPQLHRVLAPGRLYCCHVKDRILFGNVTGAGMSTVSPFHAEAIMHGLAHGFEYMGMITVVTDVVRENNQSYRLGWSENAKDGTKMGVGSPEYILLFRKPQTDRTKGYADIPVTHHKQGYTRARWQVDAHAYWRSDGNRTLTPDDLEGLTTAQRMKLFEHWSLENVYDYEAHIAAGEALDGRGGQLPAHFMLLAPASWHDDVWADVNRMRTLNTEQSRKRQALHVCPLQFDIVDRLITRFSNPGDLVYDPFSGLGTVPLMAIRAGRRGRGVELNAGYHADAVRYLQAEEAKVNMPSLFDLESVLEAS
jgi:DNA modification methylase